MKKKIGKYTFNIYNEDNGYWAECEELPGCLTQADSLDELNENMIDALQHYLNNEKEMK